MNKCCIWQKGQHAAWGCMPAAGRVVWMYLEFTFSRGCLEKQPMWRSLEVLSRLVGMN